MLFRRHKETFSLLVLAAVFFFLYLFLYVNPSVLSTSSFLILNQPDEAVNYFFIRELTLNNRFRFPEPLSAATASQVHPRSTTIINGAVVPIGFPGMIIIFSFLLKCLLLVSGESVFNLLAVSLTPLLAIATPFFFYGFLRRIFDKKIAWLSAVLLFFLPAWWYYASRPFQHNTLFVFLIVALLYCYVLCHSRPAKCGGNPDDPTAVQVAGFPIKSGMTKIGSSFLIGLLFGLAIYVRPIEAVWLSVLVAVGLICLRHYWSGRQYLAAAVGVGLMAVLFFATQTAFYGHPLASGYVKPALDGSAGLVTSGPQGIPFLKALTLPFGFHPRAILHNFRAYFIDLFGLWTAVGVVGILLIFWVKSHSKNIQYPISNIQYLSLFLLFTFYFLLFYGSWMFSDNLLKVPSIGTSYVRYFLPIYVFGLPLAASVIVWLWQRSRVLKIAAVFLVALLFLSSVAEVFAPLEGLAAIKKTVQQYQEYQSKVYQLTESGSVIITRYADKYLFPGRKVIAGWQEPEQAQAIGNLVKEGQPVYLYDLKLDSSTEKDLSRRLSAVHAKLSAPIAGWENLELRRIVGY